MSCSIIRADAIRARSALLELYADSVEVPELHAQRPMIKRIIDFLFDVLIFQNEAAYNVELTLEWLERADELLRQVRVDDAIVRTALAKIQLDVRNARDSARQVSTGIPSSPGSGLFGAVQRGGHVDLYGSTRLR